MSDLLRNLGLGAVLGASFGLMSQMLPSCRGFYSVPFGMYPPGFPGIFGFGYGPISSHCHHCHHCHPFGYWC